MFAVLLSLFFQVVMKFDWHHLIIWPRKSRCYAQRSRRYLLHKAS